MKYHDITYDDMLNGSGLRVVLWVSGCIHGCKGCHNPITWNINSGLEFDEMARNELFSYLDRDYIQGITFSGGDPLHPNNIDEILNISAEIKSKYLNKNIWLYTGYTFEDIEKLEILKYVDVLVDGKYDETLFDTKLKWVGSSNQRVIDLKKTFECGSIVIYEN